MGEPSGASDDPAVRYREAIRDARQRGPDAFQAWFDDAESAEAAARQGHWTFALQVVTPQVWAHLGSATGGTALEIGYGGGRLLNAACNYFQRAIGIDIHGERDEVERLLRAQGHSNFELIESDGESIPVESASIDFVYSFIVMQHLPRLAVLQAYLDETARVLRPGGVAQIYVGRLASLPLGRRLRWRAFRSLELPEVPANEMSLYVGTRTARSLARKAGLRVVATGRSYKRAPDGGSKPGGQTGLTLLKPL